MDKTSEPNETREKLGKKAREKLGVRTDIKQQEFASFKDQFFFQFVVPQIVCVLILVDLLSMLHPHVGIRVFILLSIVIFQAAVAFYNLRFRIDRNMTSLVFNQFNLEESLKLRIDNCITLLDTQTVISLQLVKNQIQILEYFDTTYSVSTIAYDTIVSYFIQSKLIKIRNIIQIQILLIITLISELIMLYHTYISSLLVKVVCLQVFQNTNTLSIDWLTNLDNFTGNSMWQNMFLNASQPMLIEHQENSTDIMVNFSFMNHFLICRDDSQQVASHVLRKTTEYQLPRLLFKQKYDYDYYNMVNISFSKGLKKMFLNRDNDYNNFVQTDDKKVFKRISLKDNKNKDDKEPATPSIANSKDIKTQTSNLLTVKKEDGAQGNKLYQENARLNYINKEFELMRTPTPKLGRKFHKDDIDCTKTELVQTSELNQQDIHEQCKAFEISNHLHQYKYRFLSQCLKFKGQIDTCAFNKVQVEKLNQDTCYFQYFTPLVCNDIEERVEESYERQVTETVELCTAQLNNFYTKSLEEKDMIFEIWDTLFDSNVQKTKIRVLRNCDYKTKNYESVRFNLRKEIINCLDFYQHKNEIPIQFVSYGLFTQQNFLCGDPGVIQMLIKTVLESMKQYLPECQRYFIIQGDLSYHQKSSQQYFPITELKVKILFKCNPNSNIRESLVHLANLTEGAQFNWNYRSAALDSQHLIEFGCILKHIAPKVEKKAQVQPYYHLLSFKSWWLFSWQSIRQLDKRVMVFSNPENDIVKDVMQNIAELEDFDGTLAFKDVPVTEQQFLQKNHYKFAKELFEDQEIIF